MYEEQMIETMELMSTAINNNVNLIGTLINRVLDIEKGFQIVTVVIIIIAVLMFLIHEKVKSNKQKLDEIYRVIIEYKNNCNKKD